MIAYRFSHSLRTSGAGLLLGLFLAWIVFPVITRATEPDDPLTREAEVTDVPLEEETVDGYRHIYAKVDEEVIQLTEGERNHTQAEVAREYVVWVETINGAGQIVRYHIPTDTRLYVTDHGTNQNPKVNQYGEVVWERWIDERWQLFYFDGISSRQLTGGDVSVNPDLYEHKVVFTRQNDAGEWSAHLIDLTMMEMKELMVGFEAKGAFWQFGEVVFPIKEAWDAEAARQEELAKAQEEAVLAAEAAQKEDPEGVQLLERGAITEEQYQERVKKIREAKELLEEALDKKTDLVPPAEPDGAVEEPAEEPPTEEPPTEESPVEEVPIGTIPIEEEPLPEEPLVVTEDDIIEELADGPLVNDEPAVEEQPVEATPTEAEPLPEESPVEEVPMQEMPVDAVPTDAPVVEESSISVPTEETPVPPSVEPEPSEPVLTPPPAVETSPSPSQTET